MSGIGSGELVKLCRKIRQIKPVLGSAVEYTNLLKLFGAMINDFGMGAFDRVGRVLGASS